MKFGQKVQEFLYSMSTSDKYSEFDSRRSFNRVNKPDSETNLLFSHHNQSTSEFINGGNASDGAATEGVHEVKLAWMHIKNWLLRNSPDLRSSLQDHCTSSDLNDFQKDLNIKLPTCVVEFFKLTDGQSNFGTSSTTSAEGLVFGLKLMSLDEIALMTENWRKVARIFNDELSSVKQSSKINQLSKLPSSYSQGSQIHKKLTQPHSPLQTQHHVKSSMGDLDSINEFYDLGDNRPDSPRTSRSSSASSDTTAHTVHSISPHLKIPTQRSIPPGSIHDTFAHPMWIPIITDEVGNYIGIDLAPPASGEGQVGQVILFGREFDVKFKIADNWGDFLLIFANDLEGGNWDIKTNPKNNYGDLMLGSEGTLVYCDKETKLEIPYLDVLRNRSIKNWINTIHKSGQEPSFATKVLIKELTTKDTFMQSYKNPDSIDKFITDNISSLDFHNQTSISTRSSIGSNAPVFKSPLSNEVTNDIVKQIDTSSHQDPMQ